jgi:hypothetical protein
VDGRVDVAQQLLRLGVDLVALAVAEVLAAAAVSQVSRLGEGR